jgi:hypothetical protein
MGLNGIISHKIELFLRDQRCEPFKFYKIKLAKELYVDASTQFSRNRS